MKPAKALIITNCSTFGQHAEQLIGQILNVEAVRTRTENTLKMMCLHQPPLIVIDTSADEAVAHHQLAQDIWSIEPDTRLVFCVDPGDKSLVRDLQESMPPQAVAAYVCNTPESDKVRVAIQAVSVFANSYCESSLK